MIPIKTPFIFTAQLAKKALNDDLFALSNELAYKILLSFFPFLVFLVSLLGFLDLEGWQLFEALPVDAGAVVGNFIAELKTRPSPGLLSASLLVAVYSASNGFRAVIRGVNKAHGYHDNRNWIKKTALCAALMMIFTFSIIVMLALWIFSDAIAALLPFPLTLVKLAASAVSFAVLIGATASIYYLACARHGAGRIFPGACATVALWAISSEAFGIFITHFSNISVIYGSIAGVFILIIWLNLITFFLLLGNSINALFNEKYHEKDHHSPLWKTS